VRTSGAKGAPQTGGQMFRQIRQADHGDEPALRHIDAATESSLVTPAPLGEPRTTFFAPGRQPPDVLVLETRGTVTGFIVVSQALPLPSHAHVLEVRGLAVLPEFQRRGFGRQLVRAAIDHARAAGARKLSLRVLSTNPAARALYAACGFCEEGVLRTEFLIDGRAVDDVLMARVLDGDEAGSSSGHS
jgi:ribosomal protein S18 acetylase RimI-like enzyme